jgi:3-oxoacyl-[acyl-carrier-protein] synthase-3
METDSEKLMAEGIATGAAAFEKLLRESGWQRPQIARSICHQVGHRHRAAMLEAMGLPADRDSVTFPRLGNTGSVALPLTVAAASGRGEVAAGDAVAMLGIGSGINSVMLAAMWGNTPVSGNIDAIQNPALGLKMPT